MMLDVNILVSGQRMVTPHSPKEEKPDGIQLGKVKPLLQTTSTPDIWRGYVPV
jgi:hypothetical protein